MARYSAGRSNYGGGWSEDPVKWFRAKVQQVEEEVAMEIWQAVEDGEATMKHHIETRGTGKTWEKPWDGRDGSSPGRVASGKMVDAVGSSFNYDYSSGKVSARFGWIKPSQIEDYFGYQEGGFDHAQAGVTVEGMYALVDAYELVNQELAERIKKIGN